MPGLFGIYEMSRRSLMAYQTAISTIGHNVANAGTPGFHRQRVDFGATPPARDLFGNIGTGVSVNALRRIQNRFIEHGIQREIPVLAGYAARSEALMQAETVFGEPSEGGLTTLLDEFYGGWDDLASSPEDAGVRESVVRLGTTVADAIRTSRARLESEVDDINGEIHTNIDATNRILRELARVNDSILVNEAAGNISADMQDRRDRLVENLAELVGATGRVADDGTATVWVDERVVVQRDIVQELSFEAGRAAPIMIHNRALEAPEIGGRIGGLLQARDSDLVDAVRRLDEFAARFAQDVNALHETGVDERGRPAGAFFVLAGIGPDGVEGAAARLRVSSDLLADSSGVAAGRANAPGDGVLALDIAALRNEPFGASGLLQNLIVDLGARSRESQDLLEGQQIVVESFLIQRESVSGVSLDEEAAKLLQYQRSYEAAARVLTTADEMAQTILAL